ncbi:MAG: hypothetical protein IPN17_16780 [Deltaproteobacteria bacterium]|nr:hypothetical protein [Deltaproteobacteria bacterium]
MATKRTRRLHEITSRRPIEATSWSSARRSTSPVAASRRSTHLSALARGVATPRSRGATSVDLPRDGVEGPLHAASRSLSECQRVRW